jgi:plasmid stability protein
MHQLTVRGFDKELERRLRRVANERGVSLNQAALILLRAGAGLGGERGSAHVVGDSLDDLIGSWSADDERTFRQATEAFETIDPHLWS